MDYKWKQWTDDIKKRAEEYEQALKDRAQRILDGFCYCDLQKFFEYESKICKFCYEKAKQEVDKDLLADEADYINKHNKEQIDLHLDSPWEPL
jgi:hypothetical protein